MNLSSTHLFIGTANRGFAQQAQEEIRRLSPGVKFTFLMPSEVFLIDFPAAITHIPQLLRDKELIFLRHIQPVQHSIEIHRTSADLQLIQEYIQHLDAFQSGQKAALQIRRVPSASFEYSPADMREVITPILSNTHNITLVPRDSDQIISLFLTEAMLYGGVSHPEDNLSDWSGGAIRYQKEGGQISRAKFKLLEAEEEFGLDFTQYHHALDVGAAPGGWSSLLLERGLQVTAVDPADLHPSIKQHPKLTYHKKNASEVTFASDTFDLLVCDMSWSPRQMTRLIIDLLHTLQSGGTAIITAKLMHKKPFQTVKEIRELLAPFLEIKRVKQLFHNREELTLYFTKKY